MNALSQEPLVRINHDFVCLSTYLPNHKMKSFGHGSVIFIKIASIFNFSEFVNALSHEPLVRMTSDFMCRHLLLSSLAYK